MCTVGGNTLISLEPPQELRDHPAFHRGPTLPPDQDARPCGHGEGGLRLRVAAQTITTELVTMSLCHSGTAAAF